MSISWMTHYIRLWVLTITHPTFKRIHQKHVVGFCFVCLQHLMTEWFPFKSKSEAELSQSKQHLLLLSNRKGTVSVCAVNECLNGGKFWRCRRGWDEPIPCVDSLKIKKKKMFGERRVVGNHRFIPAKKNFGPPPPSPAETGPFCERSEDVRAWRCGPGPRARPLFR